MNADEAAAAAANELEWLSRSGENFRGAAAIAYALLAIDHRLAQVAYELRSLRDQMLP